VIQDYVTNRGTPHYKLLSRAEFHFPAVAQTVGFGLERSKMLDLQWGLTDTLSASLAEAVYSLREVVGN
jgi:hypothetical protein